MQVRIISAPYTRRYKVQIRRFFIWCDVVDTSKQYLHVSPPPIYFRTCEEAEAYIFENYLPPPKPIVVKEFEL